MNLIQNYLIIRIILMVFCILTLYLLIPISIIILWIPLIFVRKTIIILKVFLRPDLVCMLNPRSVLLAVDNLSDHPHSTLLTSFDLEGPFNLEKFQENFHEKVIESKDINGNLNYPQLTQFYTNWLGFQFWKKDENFAISNHVRYFDPPLYLLNKEAEGIDEESKHLRIMAYIEKLFYPECRSPWELLILPSSPLSHLNESCQEQRKTRVIFKWHHGLCDGYSVLKIILTWSTNKPIQKFPKRNLSMITASSIVRSAFAFIVAPVFISLQLINSLDRNTWHIPEKELTKEWNVGSSSNIPIDLIRQIKNHAGVGFTSVLMAAIGQGLKKYLLKYSESNLLKKQIHVVLGLPWPNHPNILCNNWTFGYIKLPIKEGSFIEAMKACETKFEKLKSSLMPVFNYAMLSLLGFLPNCLIKHCKNLVATAIVSIVPGPEEALLFLDGEWELKMKNIFFWGGLTRGNLGIGIFIFSYNENLKIVLSIDKGIIPIKEKIDELLEQIIIELKCVDEFSV